MNLYEKNILILYNGLHVIGLYKQSTNDSNRQ